MGRHRPRPRGSVRGAVNVLLELVLTLGVVLLLFVVYQAWITDIFANHRQHEVAEGLRDDWTQLTPTPVKPDLGEGFAFIHIPEFGGDWSRAIVEGTDADELETGPGHYVGTAMPGEVGNFAVAGHRVGTGSPFLDLDQLEVGDPVVIETVDTWYVYRVTSQEIVSPSDSSVIAAVPDQLDAAPTQAYLTMTTCHPKFSARKRLVVHALLAETITKADSPQEPEV